jgi:hypothetical protein
MGAKRSNRSRLAAGLVVAGVLIGAAPAQAVTCANLQAALDSAPDGGTVALDETCHDMSFTLKPRPATASLTLVGSGGHAGFQGSAPATRILTGDDVGNITLRDLDFDEGFSGGLKITGSSGVTLDRVSFFEDSSDGGEDGGGALIDIDGGAPVVVTDSTFFESSAAGGHGGGLAVRGAPTTITGSTFQQNFAESGGGLAVLAPGGDKSLQVSNTTVIENVARRNGGGAEIVGPATRLWRTDFVANTIKVDGDGVVSGGGLYFKAGAPGLVLRQLENRFRYNRIAIAPTEPALTSLVPRGGGEWIENVPGSFLHSLDDQITSNSLTDAVGGSNRPQGGGLGIAGCKSSQGATNKLENLVVAGNRGATGAAGAGMVVEGCPSVGVGVRLIHATVTVNRTHGAGAVAGIDGTSTARLTLGLSIDADNRGGADLGSFGRRAIFYSDVCAPGVLASRGNICADPLLRAPDDPIGPDVHETQFSPTVDRGIYFFTLGSDYEGDPRPAEQEDMGADEYTAPFVRTCFATAIDPTTAILRGRASNSTYWFEYGPTTAYGSVTPKRNTPTRPYGREVVRVTARVSGLKPGRTYHFRLIATNADGTTVGRDRRFKTPG